MPILFVDTSALAKRYINEAGSNWLRSLLSLVAGGEVFIVHTAAVELISAITRRERGGSLTSAEAVTARAAFQTNLATEYEVVEVSEALIQRAMALAEHHALRGYDAIQLAGALEVRDLGIASGLPSMTLISADTELNVAARAEGLPVEDPSTHP